MKGRFHTDSWRLHRLHNLTERERERDFPFLNHILMLEDEEQVRGIVKIHCPGKS